MVHKCSKCGNSFSFVEDKVKGTYKKSFSNAYSSYPNAFEEPQAIIKLEFFICPIPSCRNVDVKMIGDKQWNNKEMWFHPTTKSKPYPEIDVDINKYYQEAHAVLNISPRASAALSRACLEAVLVKSFKLKGRLDKQIDELIKKIEDKELSLDHLFIEALHGIRNGGNAGLHEELKTEISLEEATQILEVLEMFLDEIYINRKERENKLNKVKELTEKVKKGKQTTNKEKENSE